MSIPIPKQFGAVLVYVSMSILLIIALMILPIGCYLASLVAPGWKLVGAICILLGAYCLTVFFHILSNIILRKVC